MIPKLLQRINLTTPHPHTLTPQKKKKKIKGSDRSRGWRGGEGGGTKTLLQAMRLDEVIRKVRSEVTATEVSVGMLI